MTNDDTHIRKSLIEELNDVTSLLDKALLKAKYLENNVRSNNYESDYSQKSQPSYNNDTEDLQSRPSNWDSLKNSALQDSMEAMEEEATEYSQNTKQARQVKSRTKKLRIDDNWDDDPI